MAWVHMKTGGDYARLATGEIKDPWGLVDYAPVIAYRTIREEGLLLCHRSKYEHEELNMIVYEGRMQTDVELAPGDRVVIYRSLKDNETWFRPESEFEARFIDMSKLP